LRSVWRGELTDTKPNVIEIRVHPHGSEETQASDRIAGSRNDQIEQAEHLSAGSPKEAMVPCCVAAALSFRKDRTTQGWYSAQLTRVANDSIALRFAETLHRKPGPQSSPGTRKLRSTNPSANLGARRAWCRDRPGWDPSYAAIDGDRPDLLYTRPSAAAGRKYSP
jgi:hypothetical protein